MPSVTAVVRVVHPANGQVQFNAPIAFKEVEDGWVGTTVIPEQGAPERSEVIHKAVVVLTSNGRFDGEVTDQVSFMPTGVMITIEGKGEMPH